MRQFRLRAAMLLIAVIAVSFAAGICMERTRQQALAAKPRAFTYHVGAFW